MIAFARVTPRKKPCAWHTGFLVMLPTIRRCARVAFRHLDDEAQDEAVVEVIANALVAYVRLVEQGRVSIAYPTVLARYAIAQFRAGRRVGNRLNGNEALAESVQRRRGLQLLSLDCLAEAGQWIESTLEDKRTSVPDQAAFRVDFPAWLATQSPRNQQIAEALAVGHSTCDVSRRFALSRGRVSQLRNEFYRSWERFHGEARQGVSGKTTVRSGATVDMRIAQPPFTYVR